MNLRPTTIKEAKLFVKNRHRHHPAPQGALWAIAAEHEGRVVGVAIIGRPVARMLQDGVTAEVTRLCTDGTPNACSFLYGAARRAARALGYTRLLTYILASESGVSLKAAGWKLAAKTKGGTHDRPSRRRRDTSSTEPKTRWEVA